MLLAGFDNVGNTRKSVVLLYIKFPLTSYRLFIYFDYKFRIVFPFWEW